MDIRDDRTVGIAWWFSMFNKPQGEWTLVDGFLFSTPIIVIAISSFIFANWMEGRGK